MIVVTGATGNVGLPLVQALAAAGEEVTAVSRAPADGTPAGVRGYQADLVKPDSLEPALRGARALFLLTAPGFMANGDLAAVMEIVLAAGVRRVVLLSSQGVSGGRHPSHLEDVVRQPGVEWTMLRPGGFASNAFQWAASVRASRQVSAPFGDVGLPVIDPADIAGVAAAVLRSPGHGGKVYTLTGPEAVTPRQQAAAIGDALGEHVRFAEQTRAEARDQMLGYMPEPVVRATLDVLGAPTAAEQAVSPDAARVLGRPPRTFAEWAARNVAAFR